MEKIRVPQLRVLQALRDAPEPLSRQSLSEAAGFTAVSGTLTRALNGLREGSSSGAAHLGLIDLGFVVENRIDLDGVEEVLCEITDAGRAAVAGVEALPQGRDKASSVNKHYIEGMAT